MKEISLKMSDIFKIEVLSFNKIYELENNACKINIECDVDSSLTYKLHIEHKTDKSYIVMTKGEGCIYTDITSAYFTENGSYYLQLEGLKTGFRAISNTIKLEVGGFINAEEIPSPEQQSVINGILIRVNALEDGVEDIEGDIATLETSVGAKADKSYVDTKLATKQDKLVAGTGISIASDGKTISATATGDVTKAYVDTELAKKQNTLVSGTNIKTINNQSILGDGNISIAGDVTKSYVDTQDDAIRNSIPTKTSQLTNDSDFVSEGSNLSVFNNDADFTTTEQVATQLDGKQDTLVSGENIKTINNESILGEGNITISGTGNVDDIQINGTSILDNKVANIPIGGASGVGVVRTNSSYGLRVGNDGLLYGQTRTKAQYDSGNDGTVICKGTLENVLLTKQDTLVSGTNIKTVNNQTLLGEGNITISGGSTVSIADNVSGGVDLTVDGTTKTLAKESEVGEISDALLHLNKTVFNITPNTYSYGLDTNGWATRVDDTFTTGYTKVTGTNPRATVSSGYTVTMIGYGENFIKVDNNPKYVRFSIVGNGTKSTIRANSNFTLYDCTESYSVEVDTKATSLKLGNSSDSERIFNVDLLCGLEEIISQGGGGCIELGSGDIYLAENRSIKMRPFVSIKGEGINATRLIKSSTATGTSAVFVAQGMDENYSDTFTTDFQHTDFTIDCSEWHTASTQYENGMKAYQGHYCKRALFDHIQVIGSPATGFGIDYCHEVTITNCIFENCGRCWGTLSNNGCNAIGIGTGVWKEENIIISNNLINNSGRHGVFIESQSAKSESRERNVPLAKGQTITGNIIKNGRWCGIGIYHSNDVSITGNSIYNNRGSGILLYKQIKNCEITGNTVVENGTSQDSISSYGYTIAEANMGGIRIDTNYILEGGLTEGIIINSNNINSNIGDGIYKVGNNDSYPSAFLLVSSNIIKDNTVNAVDLNGGGSSYIVKYNLSQGNINANGTYTNSDIDTTEVHGDVVIDFDTISKVNGNFTSDSTWSNNGNTYYESTFIPLNNASTVTITANSTKKALYLFTTEEVTASMLSDGYLIPNVGGRKEVNIGSTETISVPDSAVQILILIKTASGIFTPSSTVLHID